MLGLIIFNATRSIAVQEQVCVYACSCVCLEVELDSYAFVKKKQTFHIHFNNLNYC